MDEKECFKISGELKPIIQIGKQGLTENVLEEIKKHLKKRKLIKIKCLRYFLDEFEFEGNNKHKMIQISEIISKELNCKVIQIRGFTITFYYGSSS